MWSDIESKEDFLNFKAVAGSAAMIIDKARGEPLSMGICGSWGVGKSSMVNLVEAALKELNSDNNYLFVKYNAWLYQGFDDARAALLDVIGQAILEHQENHQKPSRKIKEFIARIDWWRTLGLFASSAVAVGAGLPPIGLIGEAVRATGSLFKGEITTAKVVEADAALKGVVEEGAQLVRPKVVNPPKEIHSLREQFEAALTEANIKLIVFVDDLDRCLPATLIPTLEAIRLFLMIRNTAFVIAADDLMIRKAVAKHFDGLSLDDDLVINYFDKLIQIPIRVPPLGTQDIRAYLFSLYISNSTVSDDLKRAARGQISKMLKETWKGRRLDREKVIRTIMHCPQELASQLEMADRVAPLMASSQKIGGNPRLIKRFLNTLSIRLSLAKVDDIPVDEALLSKILLFERCCSVAAFNFLVKEVNSSDSGKILFFKDLESKIAAGEDIQLPEAWKKDSDFINEWLALPPSLDNVDLRPVIYLSRDTAPLITAADVMSPEAKSVAENLVQLKSPCPKALYERFATLGQQDKSIIFETILAKAKMVEVWGTPSELYALLAISKQDSHADERITRLILALPPASFKPDFIPAIQDHRIGPTLLQKLHALPGISKAVKNAITNQ